MTHSLLVVKFEHDHISVTQPLSIFIPGRPRIKKCHGNHNASFLEATEGSHNPDWWVITADPVQIGTLINVCDNRNCLQSHFVSREKTVELDASINIIYIYMNYFENLTDKISSNSNTSQRVRIKSTERHYLWRVQLWNEHIAAYCTGLINRNFTNIIPLLKLMLLVTE